jgi:hypothetical protein
MELILAAALAGPFNSILTDFVKSTERFELPVSSDFYRDWYAHFYTKIPLSKILTVLQPFSNYTKFDNRFFKEMTVMPYAKMYYDVSPAENQFIPFMMQYFSRLAGTQGLYVLDHKWIMSWDVEAVPKTNPVKYNLTCAVGIPSGSIIYKKPQDEIYLIPVHNQYDDLIKVRSGSHEVVYVYNPVTYELFLLNSYGLNDLEVTWAGPDHIAASLRKRKYEVHIVPRWLYTPPMGLQRENLSARVTGRRHPMVKYSTYFNQDLGQITHKPMSAGHSYPKDDLDRKRELRRLDSDATGLYTVQRSMSAGNVYNLKDKSKHHYGYDARGYCRIWCNVFIQAVVENPTMSIRDINYGLIKLVSEYGSNSLESTV